MVHKTKHCYFFPRFSQIFYHINDELIEARRAH